jgi:hypothetical protein
MKLQDTSVATYDDWDFDAIWAIEPAVNGGYPYLRVLPPQ